MLGHGHHFYVFFGACPNDLVVATQAELRDFFTSFHRKYADFFTISYMVGKRSMTEFAGNRFVNAFEVHFFNVGVTGEAGVIGHVANFSVPLIHYSITPVMPVFAKRSRCGDHFDHKAQYSRYYKE
jgi:hypothetical protein